jgi:hypothetical protein
MSWGCPIAEEGAVMCYTCGCKLPYEDHGDPDNIIEEDLRKAGQTETIKRAGVKQAKRTCRNSWRCRRTEATWRIPGRTIASKCG